MPILVQSVVDKLESALDAEGSQRYDFDRDYKPAINYAQDFMVMAFNSIFSENKLSESVLKELVYIKVWIASIYSRVHFDPSIVKMDLWDIISVYPKCIISGNIPVLIPTTESIYLPNNSFIRGDYSAKRITLEEWNEKDKNVFSAGSNKIACPELIQYAWTNFANYTGSYLLTNSPYEIAISPDVSGENIAIAFLKKPTEITVITDSLEFPETLANLFVAKALEFIAKKQNDGTNLYSVSAKDTKQIIQLLS